MVNNRAKTAFLLSLFAFLSAVTVSAQPINLLRNPNADDGPNNWSGKGNAAVERDSAGNSHFAVRNGGSFVQNVVLPEGSAGKFALLIGRGLSERMNPDGAITGLPCLYGYMLEGKNPNGGTIKDYLQGHRMGPNARTMIEWAPLWGIFEVPKGAGAISFFLNQAEREGVPQNGSAARFDDLGLYLFDNAEEAKVFVDIYIEGNQAGERYSKLTSLSLPPGTGKIVEWPPVDSSLGNVIAGDGGRYIPTDIKALEIVFISAEGNRITPGVPFTAKGDWLRTLTVRLKNTSARPIKAIRFHFGLPEAKYRDGISGFSMEYGRGLSTGFDQGEQKAIAPDEELDLVRDDRQYKRTSEGIAQRTGVSNFTRVMLGPVTVKFEDGTVWTAWKLPMAAAK